MWKSGLLITTSFLIGGFGCESSKRRADDPPPTVKHVDVQKYTGKWYEIARLPFSAQEGCVATTATYSLNEDGSLDVLNECREKNFHGRLKKIKGKAKIVDSETNAKLEVKFEQFPANLVKGDYWILELGTDYEYSVVGEPEGRYLWILSRKPQMDPKLYEEIVKRLDGMGYWTNYLKKTSHLPG